MLKQVHPIIRRALTVFIAVSIVSATAVVISGTYRDDNDHSEQSEKRAMRIWKNKIDGSRESNRIIDEYESSYTRLVNNSIIGEENRLSWYETLQAIAKSRGIESVKYKVSSQKDVEDTTVKYKSDGLRISRSVMILDMKIAHEGDLFAVLNALEDRAKGLYTVDRCTLERHDKDSSSLSSMEAHCELSWYTFKAAEDSKKSS